MNQAHGFNLHHPPYEAAKCMVYFEKHRLLEVCRQLLLELGLNRTTDVSGFIKKNISRISERVNSTYAFLQAPPIFDLEALSHNMHKKFNIPTIIYTKERQLCDSGKLLKKFLKFLKKNNLTRKNVIFVNFPSNRVESLQFRKEHINPTYVFEIASSFQIPFKTKEMLAEEGDPYFEGLKQVKYFYEDAFRVINYGLAPVTMGNLLNTGQDTYMQSIDEIGLDIVKMLRNTDMSPEEEDVGKFLPRIVIFGRKGSGRKTQAKALANHFNLVFVDVQQLLLHNISSETRLGKILRHVVDSRDYSDAIISNLVQQRLLERDCLKNGWVLVGYPTDVDGFKHMQEFVVPPNKIVFLHCRERVVMRRLINSWNRMQFGQNMSNKDECNDQTERLLQVRKHWIKNASNELEYFDGNKRKILDYLATKKETIHIDGNHSRNTVTTKLFARIEQKQNGFAMKKSANSTVCNKPKLKILTEVLT
ncbi:adenylate kinase 8 isoform X1 [Hermetia illucens]|uniref:adenylate kinase 8 isoform X1 n=1 Tax=Hermetia illucens TaxID=343691 RepID=UPI0018CC091E|nr:adenylate kinase 8 isoform X1 [Hermetia illucens]